MAFKFGLHTATHTDSAARAAKTSLCHGEGKQGQKVTKTTLLAVALATFSALAGAQPVPADSHALTASIKVGAALPVATELKDQSLCTFVGHIAIQAHREVISKTCPARRLEIRHKVLPFGQDINVLVDGVEAMAGDSQITTTDIDRLL